MAKRKTTRFSSLPIELLLCILSFIIDPNNLHINYSQNLRFLMTFTSINKSLSCEMQEYFNNIWWKLFESQVRIKEKNREEFDQVKNQMVEIGNLRRKIILTLYTKQFLSTVPITRNENEYHDEEIKILLLGDGGVGKSSLIIQFIQGNFLEHNTPTIDDNYRKYVEIGGDQYLFNIFDFYGHEEYESNLFKEQCLCNSNCIVVVCSLTDPSSIDDCSLGYHMEFMARVRGIEQLKSIPIIFALNKVDDFTEEEKEEKREITEKAKQVVNDKISQYELLNTSVTSAKFNINVEEIFLDCVRLLSGTDLGLKLLKNIIELDVEYLESLKQKLIKPKQNSKKCLFM
ncbi:ras family small GTPase [Naegleria gruberi]|uniref:Ras family small GTPase n=2 Tax=Naegleria gruberi TaxID=5762 RepID=D2VSN6_NAEGR|nr:ras family small GTPase [Naegleria gruberi]EFC40222.1 ras family small GTPase [Naegleria gruberi]|eukprot:XP_002672966.1 ras family small GTPase [Naegleria gruberi strain NEG-M]